MHVLGKVMNKLDKSWQGTYIKLCLFDLAVLRDYIR
jgi:hypothetical protein